MRPAIAVVFIFASIQSLDCLTGNTNSRLNFFDIDLLRYAADNKSGNVMVSPASIKSLLAMILEGARGATADEIRTALRLPPNRDDFREMLSLFLKALEASSPSVSLHNANGLFVSKKLKLNKDYEMMAKGAYLSDVNKLDFNDPKTAAHAINDWVNSKTKGLIPTIVEQAQINPLTELLVTNALYFKGTWLHQFEPNLTHGACFYKADVCKNVAMMDLQAELNYAYVDNLRAHALELPYEGKRYSMILLIPQDRDVGVALIRDLPYIGVLQISDVMEPTDVILTMPKFTVEYSEDMVAALRSMCITSLFSPSANLSGIFDGTSAFLNSIQHTVHMSVDEKGTVAAAASAGMVVPLINDQVQLRVDRPFLFFIRDNANGVVLFEGKIEEPTEFVAVETKRSNVKGQNQLQNDQPIQPISGLSQSNTGPLNPSQSNPSKPNPSQLNSGQFNPGQSHPNQPILSQPIQPLPIQPIVSQPLSSQSSPSINEPNVNHPIPDTVTPKSARKSEVSWYKKISGYFGG